jgi:hypothetical protein
MCIVLLGRTLLKFSHVSYCCLDRGSKSQAIQAQFVTALAAVLGTSVGLLAQRSQVL